MTVCSFRYSHIGAAGYPRPTTPFLDSLAEQGAFFENAVSASSWTKPSVASILTGLTPNVHRLTEYYKWSDIVHRSITPKNVLADEIVTVAESARDAGYATMCRINNVHAGEFFRLDQGFAASATDNALNTARMVEDLERWLGQIDEHQPFFCFLMTRDAHYRYDPDYEYYVRFSRTPVVPKEEYETLYRGVYEQFKSMTPRPPVPKERAKLWIDLYDAELAQLDDALKQIPAVLARAGRLTDTIIIVTADHGERFFEHGKLGHSHFVDEATIKTPLIVSGPGIRAGKRYSQIVRSIDIYPTIADLTGSAKPTVLQGRSLAPLLRGEKDSLPAVSAFAGSLYKGVYYMVREGPYKLHYKGRWGPLLFDLEKDPGEKRNLLKEKPELAEHLDNLLQQWFEQEAALREVVATEQTQQLPPEVIESLRDLGYIE